MIEREFGTEQANQYEVYVAQATAARAYNQHVEPLEARMDFAPAVEHMNQVVSFERLTYFGYIFEESGMLAKV